MTNILKSEMFEIPEGMKALVVEVYNADGTYNTSYTITDYLSFEPKQTLKVIAVK